MLYEVIIFWFRIYWSLIWFKRLEIVRFLGIIMVLKKVILSFSDYLYIICK